MDLTIGQLIKIILGILVVVAVVVGIGYFFKDYVMEGSHSSNKSVVLEKIGSAAFSHHI